MDRGATESNVLFRNADGSLTQLRAVIVFVLLYPLLIATLWVGYRRAVEGDAAVSHPLINRAIGRSATSAFRGPMIIILAKFIVTGLNLVNLVLPVSTSGMLKSVLSPYSLWSIQANYIVTAAIIFALAFLIAKPLTKWVVEYTRSAKPKEENAHA